MIRSACRYNVSVSHILDNQTTAINPNHIQYIMIESNYEEIYMPIIYMSLSVNSDMYNKIVNNEKSAKIYLQINKYNAYSQNKLYRKYISGQFSYIASTSNINYAEDISSSNDTDSTYSVITLALMSMEILNLEKQSFNGIYQNVDQGTLILNAFAGIKSVIRAPKYNPKYEKVMIPPIASIHKYLYHLCDLCPFYDTNYLFFMDFNKAYLLDWSGDYCPDDEEQKGSVYINLSSILDDKSYYDGMEERDDGYYIYINPAYSNIYEDKQTDKIANQLVFVGDDGGVQKADLNVNASDDSTVKQSFIKKNNEFVRLYANIMNSSTVDIEVLKENIDSSIITPNKEFIINNEKDHSYDGKYIMKSKKELIRNVSGTFNCSLDLKLRKVGKIVPIKDDVEAKAQFKASPSIYRKKSSSDVNSNMILTNSGTYISRD